MSEDARLVAARDLIVRADYGQIYIESSANEDDGWPDDDPYNGALDDAVDSGRFVGVRPGLIDLMTPGQWNWNTPVRVEIWSDEPPDDRHAWDHEVDADLDVPDGWISFAGSGGGIPERTDIPPGSYRVAVADPSPSSAINHEYTGHCRSLAAGQARLGREVEKPTSGVSDSGASESQHREGRPAGDVQAHGAQQPDMTGGPTPPRRRSILGISTVHDIPRRITEHGWAEVRSTSCLCRRQRAGRRGVWTQGDGPWDGRDAALAEISGILLCRHGVAGFDDSRGRTRPRSCALFCRRVRALRRATSCPRLLRAAQFGQLSSYAVTGREHAAQQCALGRSRF